MNVPDPVYELDRLLEPTGDAGTLSGCISGVDDSVTDNRPRAPIGFRMPARERPVDPSWLLL
jgi:hypothetical protein